MAPGACAVSFRVPAGTERQRSGGPRLRRDWRREPVWHNGTAQHSANSLHQHGPHRRFGRHGAGAGGAVARPCVNPTGDGRGPGARRPRGRGRGDTPARAGPRRDVWRTPCAPAGCCRRRRGCRRHGRRPGRCGMRRKAMLLIGLYGSRDGRASGLPLLLARFTRFPASLPLPYAPRRDSNLPA